MADWFKTGYSDSMADEADVGYKAGGKGGPRRHWQPPNTTQTLLFLDDDPARFWEHQFKHHGSWKNWEPCKTRNKMEDACFPCEHFSDSYPYYVGMHTVINMTPWTSKKGSVFNYNREIFPAKLGGKDKPGVLRKLEKLKKKHGRLRGLIFEVERTGAKTEGCGDDFDLVKKIEPEAIEAFRDECIGRFLEEVNAKLSGDKKLTKDQLLKRNPWTPFVWSDVLEEMTHTNAYLRKTLVGAPASDFSDSDSDGGGGGGGSNYADDDIPFIVNTVEHGDVFAHDPCGRVKL